MTEKKDKGPETQTYRLRPGASHYVEGALVTDAEQDVELTDEQAAAFGDKFVATGKAERSDTKLTGTLVVAAPTSHAPQDLGAKTLDPTQPRTNVGNQIRGGGVVPGAAPTKPYVTNPEALKTTGKTDTDAPHDLRTTGNQPVIRDVKEATNAGGTAAPGPSSSANAPKK